MGVRARRSPTAKQLDRAHLGRTSDADDLQIVRAEGSHLFDVHGKRYLDFVMGWCVGNLGWNAAELRARVRQFDGPDYVLPSLLYKPAAELAALLAEITPGKLTRAFRATGGSEAVELALQAAQSFTGRKKFVAIADGYHGNSFAEKALQRHTIKPPLDGDALDRVERALKKRDVAAFIMEPIICNLGALAPSPDFMRGLGELCARYGTLFVADEVACGFGRTGKLFACEHYDVEPDIMCLAKALSGGVAPIGATIMTDEVFDGLDDDFAFYSTYGWHPLAVEAALANVKYWKRHARTLLDNVVARGAELAMGLRDIAFGSDVEVRATGLAIGLKFDDEDYAGELEERCRDEGLLISSDDDLAMLFPALTVDAATIAEALAIIAAAAARPRTRSYSRSWDPASGSSRARSTDRRRS